MKIVLTGKMSDTRNEMTKKWQGISIQKAVSNKTDFLVTGDMIGETQKYSDAVSKGIKIVTESEFWEELITDYPEYLL